MNMIPNNDLPRVLVIDDQYGRDESSRQNFLDNSGLSPEDTMDPGPDALAMAVFCSGQRENDDGTIVNDYQVVREAVAAKKNAWALVLLDRRFVSSPTTAQDATFGDTIKACLAADHPGLPVVQLTVTHQKNLNPVELYVSKMLTPRDIRRTLLQHGRLSLEQRDILLELDDEIVADAATFSAYLLAYINAPNWVSILISGENGTGKETLARYIHRISGRAGRLIEIDSPTRLRRLRLPGTPKTEETIMVESGGTLFFTEVYDLPQDELFQFLRAVQNNMASPTWKEGERSFAVGIVGATGCDLAGMVESGKFREDLYYRLNTVTISLPPLRKRPADIRPLAHRFLAQAVTATDKKGLTFADDAVTLLAQHHFSGNAHELESLIWRLASTKGNNQVISKGDLRSLLPALTPSRITASPQELYEKIRTAVDKASRGYCNSLEVLRLAEQSFDLRDIYILGAITGSDCLVTGKTGAGKTKLATMVMLGLFGDKGSACKTITPAMQPDDFLDIDFEVMQQGGTLQKAIRPLSILCRPGVVLNEANRAPGVIQNFLIPYLDREMDIQGKEFAIGQDLGNGERYQFRILTINEGEEYAVEGMDRALRDRAVIEIPVDIFYQTGQDCLEMLLQTSTHAVTTKESHASYEFIRSVYHQIRDITVHKKAYLFLVYLSGMSLCKQIKTAARIKECIPTFSRLLCQAHDGGCRHAQEYPPHLNPNNLCGSVFAPSQRTLVNLIQVARGAAWLRVAKTGQRNPELTLEDIVTVAPLVLFNKLGLDPEWIRDNYSGDRWGAVCQVVEVARIRFTHFVNEYRSKSFSQNDLQQYAEDKNDYWVMRFVNLYGQQSSGTSA